MEKRPFFQAAAAGLGSIRLNITMEHTSAEFRKHIITL